MIKKIIVALLLSVLWIFVSVLWVVLSLEKYNIFLMFIGWCSYMIYDLLTDNKIK